jgi:hypothetical protein
MEYEDLKDISCLAQDTKKSDFFTVKINKSNELINQEVLLFDKHYSLDVSSKDDRAIILSYGPNVSIKEVVKKTSRDHFKNMNYLKVHYKNHMTNINLKVLCTKTKGDKDFIDEELKKQILKQFPDLYCLIETKIGNVFFQLDYPNRSHFKNQFYNLADDGSYLNVALKKDNVHFKYGPKFKPHYFGILSLGPVLKDNSFQVSLKSDRDKMNIFCVKNISNYYDLREKLILKLNQSKE